MTIGGALSELNNLLKADDIPFYYKPSIKAVIDTITLSRSENPNKWIPVIERLPEEETDVLICNGNGDIELSSGSYSTEVENDFIWYTSGWRFGKVIAWMPLPQPYKAERKG